MRARFLAVLALAIAALTALQVASATEWVEPAFVESLSEETPVAAAAAPAKPWSSSPASGALQHDTPRSLLQSTATANSCSSGGKSGSCVASATCKGTIMHNLCHGTPADIICCINSASTAPVTPSPAPVTPSPAPVTPSPAPGNNPSSDPFYGVRAIVKASKCQAHQFTSMNPRTGKTLIQGKLPHGFAEGVALTFAKAVCQPNRADVLVAGAAATGAENDIFTQYAAIFKAAGAVTNVAGLANVRHLYALLFGLGMCESSGIYCTGRDMSSGFSSADSAEAGLFQTSWGAHTRNAQMGALLAKYKASSAGCLLSTFSSSQHCSDTNLKNWGTGDGATWQSLTKQCPAFAVEYASVLLRYNAGPKGEWNPLRKRYAEFRIECDDMLNDVAKYVAANPTICAALAK